MRQIFLIIVPLILTNCTYDKVLLNDVSKLVSNQMENNRIEIQRIKEEIKAMNIDKLNKNISLVNRLDSLHQYVLRLNDILDSVDQDVALRLTTDFRNRQFYDLNMFNEVPLELNSATPNPLLKLHISTLEAFLITQQRSRFDFGVTIGFDSLAMQISPKKVIFNKGEKITGKLIIVGAVRPQTSKKVIKKMTLNGQEIMGTKEGWEFEFKPDVVGKGLLEYELKCEAVVNDTTTLKGRQIIYIRN